MAFSRRDPPHKQRFMMAATVIGLASMNVCDELIEIEDAKGELSREERLGRLNCMKDSLSYYCNPKGYDGKMRPQDTIFSDYEGRVILGDQLTGDRAGERKPGEGKVILEKLCAVLEPSTPRQKRVSYVGELIDFFAGLQKKGLDYYNSPPPEIPPAVRSYAARLAKGRTNP